MKKRVYSILIALSLVTAVSAYTRVSPSQGQSPNTRAAEEFKSQILSEISAFSEQGKIEIDPSNLFYSTLRNGIVAAVPDKGVDASSSNSAESVSARPTISLTGVWQSLAARACAGEGRASAECRLEAVTCRTVVDDVVEYSAEVRVGAGSHDVIGLHRVVRETAPDAPVRTEHTVMLVHGDVWDFGAIFLGTAARGVVARGHSLATYLAQRDIDVWGIDHRWTRVPADTADQSFMRSWGVDSEIADLRIATSIQRVVRASTGSGHGQTALLGLSGGVSVVYAYVDYETQLPAGLRNVNALVPLDGAIKFDPADARARQIQCDNYASLQAQFDAGVSAADNGILHLIGSLAENNPAGQPPAFFGLPSFLTNRLFALVIGSTPPPFPYFAPWYHFVAGEFGPSGLPTACTIRTRHTGSGSCRLVRPTRAFAR